jgi:acyl-CoA thioester hydrolase
MAVAHHTRHVAWFEVGRTELLRAAGFPYARLEQDGILFPLTGLEVRFLAAARYDDLLEIETRLESTGGARVAFAYTLRRSSDGEILATGRTEHAAVDRSFRPRRLPAPLRARLSGSDDFPAPDEPC